MYMYTCIILILTYITIHVRVHMYYTNTNLYNMYMYTCIILILTYITIHVHVHMYYTPYICIIPILLIN